MRPLTYFLLLAALSAQTTKVAYQKLEPALIQQRLETVTRKDTDRRAALASLFEQAGCETSAQTVPHSKQTNLICTLPGADPAAGTIVVGGHYDHVALGMGAVDDWSGAVMLPSLYESLKSQPRRHTFTFVAFAAEEVGLLGSKAYVRLLSPAARETTRAMVNLECLGVTPPKVWASRADRILLNNLVGVAQALKIDIQGSNPDRVGDDDSHPFLDARIPVISIHSLTSETLPILHSVRDQLAAIHPGEYYDAYRLSATYLAYLDGLLDQPATNPVSTR